MEVALGGLVVSVFAIRPKFPGFKIRPKTMDFMTTKVRSTTCFPGEVKPLAHVVRLYEMLKNPADMKEMLRRQYSWPFLAEFIPFRY
jgi:hypothetical protein